MIDIENTPRPWGGGNHLSQTDMDDLEVRKSDQYNNPNIQSGILFPRPISTSSINGGV